MKKKRPARTSATLVALVLLACVAASEAQDVSRTPRKGDEKVPLAENSAGAKGLPAFPGAEGWGALSTGGRGGKVIHVTTLADSGPGSLREALSTEGPRIIVFDVGGVIDLKSVLQIGPLFKWTRWDNAARKFIFDPKGKPWAHNITIAGQTAPGGITLMGATVAAYGCEDLIMRHLHLRGVHNVAVHGEEGDLLSTSFTRRTIVDHCSFTGGMDEEVENIWSADYTMQWCTVEESAKFGQGGAQHKEGDHNYGFLSGYNAEQGISVHHTLFAHHGQRTPWCKLGPAEVRNTVVYNGDGVHLGAPAKGEEFNPAGGAFNLVGNYYRAAAVGRRELILWVIQAGDKGASVYFRDNFLDRDKDQRSVDDPTIKVPAAFSRFDAGVAVLKEPIAVPFLGKTHTSKEAYDVVLAQAGAWPRDATTRRTVKEVRERTGQFGLRGPYEQFAAREDGPTSAKFDTDRDGMPDAWEIAHGLNPNDPTDGNKIVPKGASKDDRHAGYTYVEYYLNELADSLVGIEGPLCEVTVEADGKGQIAAVHGGKTAKWNSRQPPKEVDWGTIQVFNKGSTVGLKAVPDEGEAFDHWSGGSVDGSKEPIVWLHVEANTKVVAHFAAKVK